MNSEVKSSILNKIKKSMGFYFDYNKFSAFINRSMSMGCSNKDNKNSNVSCILVLPWMGTAVPWYSISLALLLSMRGRDIFILLDDMPFGDDEYFHKVQVKLIIKTLKKTSIKWVKLSQYTGVDDPGLEIENEIVRLVKINSIHYTRGESNTSLREAYESKIQKQLTRIHSNAGNFFNAESFSQIIMPGGIWGASGVFSMLAKQHGVQISTYDSGKSILLVSIFGVAAQLNDIPFTFTEIIENQDEKDFARQKGLEQLQKRRQGSDTFSHFKNGSNIDLFGEGYYLLLLNSVWDSAALGLHTVYETMLEWIFDSVDWVLNNSDRVIVIRQHPVERNIDINNTDSYGEKIKSRFENNARVVFISAEKEINTYDLICNCCCVLGFSSTSIVESVALRKPAIIVSSAYYARFGFVYNSCSRDEYYHFLQKADSNELVVSQDMIDKALICNYVTQTCNWYHSQFTPNPSDFSKWVNKSLDDLSEDYLPIKAIIDNTPLSLLQHRLKINEKYAQKNNFY